MVKSALAAQPADPSSDPSPHRKSGMHACYLDDVGAAQQKEHWASPSAGLASVCDRARPRYRPLVLHTMCMGTYT